MATSDGDSGREKAREHRAPAVPGIKSAVARRVRYDKERRFFAEGKELAAADGVEIDVETDAEFPIAGTGPALFVGGVPIVDSQRIGERRYRFFAPPSLALAADAPLALGRAGTGTPRPAKPSRVRLEWTGGSPR